MSNVTITSGRGLLLMLSLNGSRLELRRADGALAVSFVRQ
jgi:hypothetical protein